MKGLRDLIREARRRRVFRAVGFYVVVAWGVLQVADLLFDSWGISSEALRYVWIAGVVCSPLVLVFGWLYDITSEGIKRTPPAGAGDEINLRLRSIDYTILAALAGITAFVSIDAFEKALQTPVERVADHRRTRDIRAIAVLPFLNLSEFEDTEYFSDGLTEEVLNVLGNLAEMQVAARSSSFFYKDSDIGIEEIGERLGVDAVLEGSVRREFDQVRVTAQLIDVSTGFQLWSQSYDRTLEGIFAIQSDIARQVALALDVVLSSDSERRIDAPYTENVDAYEAYLRGRDYLRRPRVDDNLVAAAAQFQRATGLDRDFAQAYAGLCDARLVSYHINPAADLFQQAEDACQQALVLDSSAPDVFIALGNLNRLAGHEESSIRYFDRALELNPTSVDALLSLGKAYAAQNDAVAAEKTFRQAIALDPSYGNAYQDLGIHLFNEGRFAEAATNFREVIRWRPDNSHAYSNMGAAYSLAGDFAEAAIAYRKSLEISPTKGAYTNIGTMHYYLGDFEEAVKMYRQAIELAPEDAKLWGNIGDAYSYGGGRESDAQAAYLRAVSLSEANLAINPEDPDVLSDMAYFLARTGDSERAREFRREALRAAPDDMYVQFYAALVSQALNEPERAVVHIERAMELQYPMVLLTADPGLAELMQTRRIGKIGES